ncbi:MAG: Flp pilus assembly complex ATPase component TadA [Actinobacteria bacterium]|nr:Flp pilus assembly complex ATPase component TadA [Actinomycetota bacterium]
MRRTEMAMAENDTPAAPPLEGGPGVRRSGALDGAPGGVAAVGRDAALRAVQVALLKEIDTAISRLEHARIGESTHEHLEILRGLLKAQVTAYLEHFVARRATLFSHTSTMYAGDMGGPGVISTTFRGLLEGGTLTGGQGATLAQLLTDRRTLVIFGDRATGKSTLLNSLFELISVDERFVAVERGPDLPALKERAFCVRLGVDGDTDVPALFAKARRMTPGRLVVGEMHAPEARGFFAMLADDPRVGGLATLRAETVGRAVDDIVAALGGSVAEARALVASVRPVFVHMRSDEKCQPRLAAVWSVEGLRDGELVLREIDTGAPAASQLEAEA